MAHELLGQVADRADLEMLDRQVIFAPVHHHVRRENQVEPVLRRKLFQHPLPHLVPGRQIGVEMRVVDDDRLAIGENRLRLRTDGVEFGIADDGMARLGDQTHIQHPVANLGAGQQHKIKLPDIIAKADGPVPGPVRYINQPKARQAKAGFQHRRRGLRHHQHIQVGKNRPVLQQHRHPLNRDGLADEPIDQPRQPVDGQRYKLHMCNHVRPQEGPDQRLLFSAGGQYRDAGRGLDLHKLADDRRGVRDLVQRVMIEEEAKAATSRLTDGHRTHQSGPDRAAGCGKPIHLAGPSREFGQNSVHPAVVTLNFYGVQANRR